MSPNYMIRLPYQGLRQCQAEGLRGLQIDDELEGAGLLDGQIARLGALQDLLDVSSGAPPLVGGIRPKTDQAAGVHIVSRTEDGRQPAPLRKHRDLPSARIREGIRSRHD